VNDDDANQVDWAAWSREAVQLMAARNAHWQATYELDERPFRWDLEAATIRFERPDDAVVASLIIVGTTSAAEGTFLWSWANGAIPPPARQGLDTVREFGIRHDLTILTEPEFKGGRPEALEASALAGRILDASGVFIDPAGDVTSFFVLTAFRVEAS
jgi:hypothetical protein